MDKKIPLREMTHEKWKEQVHEICKTDDSHWKAEGDWLYPDANNTIFHGVLSHLCTETRKSSASTPYNIDRCEACGEEPPAGIKMLALLERLP